MSRRILTILFLVGICSVGLLAQDVKVKGHFETDSIRIGEAVPYSLTVRYPSTLNLILPDTTFSFAPFEFQKKKFFPTVTKGSFSYDSVVYFLTTYEIDTIQTLRLPAFVIHPGDCTTVESNTDTIIFQQLVHEKLDSLAVEKLPLMVNTDYLSVSWLLNYPLLLIIGGVLIVALIVLWFIFGRRIIRHYRLKRLTKTHLAFVEQFNASVRNLHESFSSDAAEAVFVLWKKYMENLVSRPYTRYTATEIIKTEKDAALGQALHAINRIIYAGINPSSEESFAQLRDYTEQQFIKKAKEVQHG